MLQSLLKEKQYGTKKNHHFVWLFAKRCNFATRKQEVAEMAQLVEQFIRNE